MGGRVGDASRAYDAARVRVAIAVVEHGDPIVRARVEQRPEQGDRVRAVLEREDARGRRDPGHVRRGRPGGDDLVDREAGRGRRAPVRAGGGDLGCGDAPLPRTDQHHPGVIALDRLGDATHDEGRVPGGVTGHEPLRGVVDGGAPQVHHVAGGGDTSYDDRCGRRLELAQQGGQVAGGRALGAVGIARGQRLVDVPAHHAHGDVAQRGVGAEAERLDPDGAQATGRGTTCRVAGQHARGEQRAHLQPVEQATPTAGDVLHQLGVRLGELGEVRRHPVAVEGVGLDQARRDDRAAQGDLRGQVPDRAARDRSQGLEGCLLQLVDPPVGQDGGPQHQGVGVQLDGAGEQTVLAGGGSPDPVLGLLVRAR